MRFLAKKSAHPTDPTIEWVTVEPDDAKCKAMGAGGKGSRIGPTSPRRSRASILMGIRSFKSAADLPIPSTSLWFAGCGAFGANAYKIIRM